MHAPSDDRFRRACRLVALLAGLVATVACVSACASPARPPRAAAPAPRTSIVFLSDFGAANDAVAICKAILVGIAPDARVMDITHQVTPFSIEEGARFLAAVSPYYPAGTVFLAVVDPGVGTSRKAVVVRTKRGQYFVLPDNGLVTSVVERDGLDAAREITNPAWTLQTPRSSTFHGRDVFSPAAAHLAAGWPFDEIGPNVPELARLVVKVATVGDAEARGDVIALDAPYGSLVTNIPASAMDRLGWRHGDLVPLVLDGKPLSLPFVKTFGDVAVGASLLYVDSRGRLGIAVNQGNYAHKFGVEPPAAIVIAGKGRREATPESRSFVRP